MGRRQAMHSNVDILRVVEQPTRQTGGPQRQGDALAPCPPEVTYGASALESTSQKVHVG